jgi:hypothetical protein
MWAASGGRVDMAEMLLGEGADKAAKDEVRLTQLHIPQTRAFAEGGGEVYKEGPVRFMYMLVAPHGCPFNKNTGGHAKKNP